MQLARGEHGPKGFSNPKDLYKSLLTGVRLNTHAYLFQCNTKGLTTGKGLTWD